jgi:hypothetical protein
MAARRVLGAGMRSDRPRPKIAFHSWRCRPEVETLLYHELCYIAKLFKG